MEATAHRFSGQDIRLMAWKLQLTATAQGGCIKWLGTCDSRLGGGGGGGVSLRACIKYLALRIWVTKLVRSCSLVL